MPASAPLPRHIAIAFAAATLLTLSACAPAPDEAEPQPAPATVAATAPEAAPAGAPPTAANALAALSAEELRERASTALRAQRLHSPAGDNAMEYYLALRAKSATPHAAAESALIDLMPYALIAAEQAINANDYAEAERLLELMARADVEAPSLPRIREAIAAGRGALADRERLAEEQRQRQAEEQRQRAAATPAPAVATPVPAPTLAPAPAPTAEPVPTAPAPAAPVAATAAQTAPAPAPVRSGPPRPISTPPPPYPREAARSRASGTVVVQYTIGADGRVGNVTVLRSRPRGLFEESVIATVSTWRFEPTGEEVTQTRTFDFSM